MTQPDPNNIVSITYKLQKNITDPSQTKGSMPMLVVQFEGEDSLIRSKVVGFDELSTYLKYLKQRADDEGDTLTCLPANTYPYNIVIFYQ